MFNYYMMAEVGICVWKEQTMTEEWELLSDLF